MNIDFDDSNELELDVVDNNNATKEVGHNVEKIIVESEVSEIEDLQVINNQQISSDNMKIESREREARLRAISQQLRTPSGLTKLEDVPAYKRNNVELEETTPSSSNEDSNYILSESDKNKTFIKTNNSFLHDNVD